MTPLPPWLKQTVSTLKSTRGKTLKQIYRQVYNHFQVPQTHEKQYASEKKTPPPVPADITEGTLEAEFSEVDELGFIVQRQDHAQAMEKMVNTESSSLHERLVRQTEEDLERPDPDYPFFDCPALDLSFVILGVRDGDLHVLGKNALGHTNQAVIKAVFNDEGKLQVQGLTVRTAIKGSQKRGIHRYEHAGLIDFSEYIGLTAHTLTPLEDTINSGMKKIVSGEMAITTLQAHEKKKAHEQELGVLQNIRSLLSNNTERRQYQERRAPDNDRRLADDRRVFIERRSGSERRTQKEKLLKVLLEVQAEDMRRQNERRMDLDRRLHASGKRRQNERRSGRERRSILRIHSLRRAVMRDEAGRVVGRVSDEWVDRDVCRNDQLETNCRGEFDHVTLILSHPSGVLALQGDNQPPQETFIRPKQHSLIDVIANGHTLVDVGQQVVGRYHLTPRQKGAADCTVVIPEERLSDLTLSTPAKKPFALTLGEVTVTLTAHWKRRLVRTGSDGKVYNIGVKRDLQALQKRLGRISEA